LASGETHRAERTEYQAVAEFRAALRRFGHVSDEIARRHGLTMRRYELLLMIAGTADGRAPTISELAERMQLAPHTVTELVARAARAGLVRRETDDADRRINRVALTETGEARLDETIAALRPERERVAEMLAEVYERARELSGAGQV
jgi:DNA-binding MarR family transcriptional regulator